MPVQAGFIFPGTITWAVLVGAAALVLPTSTQAAARPEQITKTNFFFKMLKNILELYRLTNFDRGITFLKPHQKLGWIYRASSGE